MPLCSSQEETRDKTHNMTFIIATTGSRPLLYQEEIETRSSTVLARSTEGV